MPRADVKVGFACNNRCVFCAQGHKREGCAQVPFDQLLDRLQQGRRTSDELVLTGGEPTLRRDLVRIVSAARTMGYRSVQIQTNGRMLAYRPLLRELIEAGVTEVSPAIHGPDADVHDALTRAPGSHAQTYRGILNAVECGLVVITNSVVVRANVQRLPELIDLLGSLGVSQSQLAFVHPVGTAWERFDEVVPRLPHVVEPLRVCVSTAARRNLRLVTEAVPLCFLPGMTWIAVEATIPSTTVIDLDGVPFDYSRWRPSEGKTHGPCCVHCALLAQCEGPWREYVDRLGWSEFEPVVQAATSLPKVHEGTGSSDREP